jgi:hypothetical protein
MDTYHLHTHDGTWILQRNEAEEVLRSFDTKQEGVAYSRDFVREHGGVLQIWKRDGTLEEERTYLAEPRAEGLEATAVPPERLARSDHLAAQLRSRAWDMMEGTGRALGTMNDYLFRGTYNASYYAAYGVVLAGASLAHVLPRSVVEGMRAGAHAALRQPEEKDEAREEPPIEIPA